MTKHVYEISVEIKPMPGSGMPDELAGAFVYCYVPADNLEDSIVILKEILNEDRYQLIDIEYATRLDLQVWQPVDTQFPSSTQLQDLEQGEIYYSPFYGYPSHYQH